MGVFLWRVSRLESDGEPFPVGLKPRRSPRQLLLRFWFFRRLELIGAELAHRGISEEHVAALLRHLLLVGQDRVPRTRWHAMEDVDIPGEHNVAGPYQAERLCVGKVLRQFVGVCWPF